MLKLGGKKDSALFSFPSSLINPLCSSFNFLVGRNKTNAQIMPFITSKFGRKKEEVLEEREREGENQQIDKRRGHKCGYKIRNNLEKTIKAFERYLVCHLNAPNLLKLIEIWEYMVFILI